MVEALGGIVLNKENLKIMTTKELQEIVIIAEQKEMLDKRFEEWRGEQEQVDDVTIIGVKI